MAGVGFTARANPWHASSQAGATLKPATPPPGPSATRWSPTSHRTAVVTISAAGCLRPVRSARPSSHRSLPPRARIGDSDR